MILTEFMIFLTDSILYLLLLIFPLYLWGKNKNKLFFYLSSSFLVGVLVYLLKLIFSIPRPAGAMIKTFSPAFPSLHSALAFFTLGFFFDNKKWRIPLLIYACLIAYSRIFLKVHYWPDVIAGAIIGFTIPFLIYQIGVLKKK